MSYAPVRTQPTKNYRHTPYGRDRNSSSTSTSSNYKTVMCLYWETGCPRQSTCIFAHTAEELRPRMCPHGNQCRFDRRSPTFDVSRRPCGFFHPGETVNKEEMFKRATEFSVAKPVPMPGSIAVKTKLCPMWNIGCANPSDCTMAHSKEELTPEYCKHGAKCYFNAKRADFNPAKKPCHFFHPGDTMDEVFARALHKIQVAQEKSDQVPQFVVKVAAEELEVEVVEEEEIEEGEVEEPKETQFSISAIEAWAEKAEEEDYTDPPMLYF